MFIECLDDCGLFNATTGSQLHSQVYFKVMFQKEAPQNRSFQTFDLLFVVHSFLWQKQNVTHHGLLNMYGEVYIVPLERKERMN